jgi:hypothetical protein
MAAVYSALGLFKMPKHLDPTTIQRGHEWKASKLIPFGGRMVAEKMNCQGEDKIRILVNDRVMPLDSCGGVEGICDLETFIKSQTYAREEGQGFPQMF